MTTAAKPHGPGQVPSPCNGVCRIDPASGWCEGCRRSLDEIAAWSGMNDEQRREVWRLLPERHAQAVPKN
jgi:predicted Fe-S protein YdhL (DUF1289 family)